MDGVSANAVVTSYGRLILISHDSTSCLNLKVLEALVPLVAQLLGVRIAMLIFRLILVEIPRIGRSAEMRHYRAIHFSPVQTVPLDVLEPRMRLDASSSTANIAEALGCVDGAETGYEVAGVWGHGRGEAHFSFYDSAGFEYAIGGMRGWRRTVRRSSWGFGPRRAVGRRGTRRPGYRMPTSRPKFRALVVLVEAISEV
jgi:hypothetical protein